MILFNNKLNQLLKTNQNKSKILYNLKIKIFIILNHMVKFKRMGIKKTFKLRMKHLEHKLNNLTPFWLRVNYKVIKLQKYKSI